MSQPPVFTPPADVTKTRNGTTNPTSLGPDNPFANIRPATNLLLGTPDSDFGKSPTAIPAPASTLSDYSSFTTNTIFPPFDLERRALPPETRRLLEERARLYGQSLNSSTYSSGKSHAGIDGVYFKLRGQTGRPGGTFLDLPNEETNPDTVSALYNNRFTPPITVQNITINVGGPFEFGALWVIEGTIVCYTIDDLEQVEEHFLVPGNKIYFSAGYREGWMPNIPKASDFQLPNGWEAGGLEDHALRVTAYTFAYREGKWICGFRAIGVEDVFLNLRIPYTVESTSYTICFTDGRGTKQSSLGIGQAMYFVDAVGNELSSLSATEKAKVIGPGTFLDFNPIGKQKKGEIIPFDPIYWQNEHYILTGDKGTNYDDPIGGGRNGASSGLRLYFTFEYIVNRIINDLVLRSSIKDTGFLEKSLNKLLEEDLWYIKFDEKSFNTGEVPSESDLPFLSADPSKVIFLGRANYKNKDGLGVDFTEVVESKNGSAYPKAVNGNIVDISKILIHASVIEGALRQASDRQEYTAKGKDDQVDAQVLTINEFFKYVCGIINNCTGGFVTPRLVQDPILDTIKAGQPHPSKVTNLAASEASSYECVEFDPIKGDGNTRTLDITGGKGSPAYEAALLKNALGGGDGEIGGFLRDSGPDLQADQEKKKALLEKKIKEIKERLGAQKFITSDVNDAVATWHQYYNFRKSLLGKANLADQGGKMYYFPSLSLTVNMHGTWGFKLGQFMSTTAVPNQYRVLGPGSFNGKGFPFMIHQVTNTLDFAKNDWSTTLGGMLTFTPDNLTKVDLRQIAQAG